MSYGFPPRQLVVVDHIGVDASDELWATNTDVLRETRLHLAAGELAQREASTSSIVLERDRQEYAK